MQNQEYIRQYEINLDKIRDLNAKDLIRRDELGAELNFGAAEDDIEMAINLFKCLIDLDISLVPNDRIKDLNISMSNFLGYVDAMKSYSASQGISVRDERIRNIRNNYVNWFNAVSGIIAFCIKSGTDYDALQRKAREALVSFEALQEQAKIDREQAKIEIEETKKAVQKAAAEVGVTQHTTNFKEAADYFDANRSFWMKVIIGIAITSILYIFGIFVWVPVQVQEPYFYSFLQGAMPRFAGLLVLFYLLTIATGNYRAQAHNYIVNKNKQNALSTFETFVKATDNEEIKNAVLLQTTKAIFNNTQSGYLKNECIGEESSQIIEVFKDFSKMPKS